MGKPHCEEHMRFNAQCETCAKLFEDEQKTLAAAKDADGSKTPTKPAKKKKTTKAKAKKTTSPKKVPPVKKDEKEHPYAKYALGPIGQVVVPVGKVAGAIAGMESFGYTYMDMSSTQIGTMLLLFRKNK